MDAGGEQGVAVVIQTSRAMRSAQRLVKSHTNFLCSTCSVGVHLETAT